MRIISMIIVTAAIVVLTGCVSDAQWADTASMHRRYVSQQRTFNSFEATGSNMTFTVSGANKISMSAPLNPLTDIPQFPDVAHEIVDGVKTVAGYATMGYIGGKAVKGLNHTPMAAPATP